MGKMIDAQSIVVAAAATGHHGQEGAILRSVFGHSIALAVLAGLLVLVQAYVWTAAVPWPRTSRCGWPSNEAAGRGRIRFRCVAFAWVGRARHRQRKQP